MTSEKLYPDCAEKLNWGALLITPIWSIIHKKYLIFILSLIPGVGILASFMSLIYGGRWAWDSKQWESEFIFKENCTYWNIAGFAAIILISIIIFLIF